MSDNRTLNHREALAYLQGLSDAAETAATFTRKAVTSAVLKAALGPSEASPSLDAALAEIERLRQENAKIYKEGNRVLAELQALQKERDEAEQLAAGLYEEIEKRDQQIKEQRETIIKSDDRIEALESQIRKYQSGLSGPSRQDGLVEQLREVIAEWNRRWLKLKTLLGLSANNPHVFGGIRKLQSKEDHLEALQRDWAAIAAALGFGEDPSAQDIIEKARKLSDDNDALREHNESCNRKWKAVCEVLNLPYGRRSVDAVVGEIERIRESSSAGSAEDDYADFQGRVRTALGIQESTGESAIFEKIKKLRARPENPGQSRDFEEILAALKLPSSAPVAMALNEIARLNGYLSEHVALLDELGLHGADRRAAVKVLRERKERMDSPSTNRGLGRVAVQVSESYTELQHRLREELGLDLSAGDDAIFSAIQRLQRDDDDLASALAAAEDDLKAVREALEATTAERNQLAAAAGDSEIWRNDWAAVCDALGIGYSTRAEVLNAIGGLYGAPGESEPLSFERVFGLSLETSGDTK